MEAAEPLPDETEDGFGAEDETTDFEPEPELEPEPEPAPEPEPEPEAAPAVEAASETAEPETAEPEPTEPAVSENAPEVAAAPAEPAEVADTEVAESADAHEDEDAEDGPPASVQGMAPPKRDLDQNLRAILQEEVAREMAARAADTGTTVIETPPTPAETDTPAEDTSDLELIREPSKPFDDDSFPAIGPAPTPDRVDIFAAAPDLDAADKASRKDLFPDIEEINSTLDSHGLAEEDEDEIETDEPGGFGRAFFAVIAIAALLLALYLTAPSIAARVPALEPALSAYVGAINGLRGLFSGLI